MLVEFDIDSVLYYNITKDSHLYMCGMTNKNTVGTTEIHAHGECVSPSVIA